MFGHLASGAAAAAGSGGYTATWVLLSHSGTFEDQTGKTHTTTGSGTVDDETPFKKRCRGCETSR